MSERAINSAEIPEDLKEYTFDIKKKFGTKIIEIVSQGQVMIPLIRKFISAGAAVTIKNKWGQTALATAKDLDILHEEIINLLEEAEKKQASS